ncbi:hypothetical protein [Cystobacter ferrugineus]|nr:hypothetical protein [Cystobacter ferrugineus]
MASTFNSRGWSMMRHVMKTLSLVSMAVLAACGGGVETSHEETAAQVGQGLVELSESSITSALQSTLNTGNAKYRWTEGYLRRFDFSGSATIAQADAAVLALQEYEAYGYFGSTQAISYADWKNTLYSEFQPLHSQILSTYSNGTETVQVVTHYYEQLVAAGSTGWFRLTVILFPQSRKVIVFEQTGYEV